jgi:hypothetical protein
VQLRVSSIHEVGEGAVLPEPPGKEEQLAALGQGLNYLFDEEKLGMLCLRLGVAYDDLPGADKGTRIKALLARIAGEDRLFELVRQMRDLLVELGDEVPEPIEEIVASGTLDAGAQRKPPARFECEYTYTIYGSGDVVVDTHVVPGSDLPFLPRIGLQMCLPGQYDGFSWYGRGPHESYVDRKLGARVGVYSGTVDDQYVPYVMPQENGNKTDVRWVALADEGGVGLLAVGMPLLNVSAHHYTTEDLTRATHTYELERRDDVTLNLDYAQGGLGNESCGPGVLPQYLLQPQEVRFRLRLRPFAAGDGSPVELSKQTIEEV